MARRKNKRGRAKPRGGSGGRRTTPSGGRRATPSRATEWVGGRLRSPFFITEGEPYRPEMILWFELPQGLVLSCTLGDREGLPASFAETLRDAMEAPMVGPPRRPARIRVADARLAAEVRQLAPEIDVRIAPTPELDEVLQHMAEFDPGGDEAEAPSYLEGGRVSEDTIADLFRAADLLYQTAPWKAASDDQVLRLDIPALGVEGACVSIIGAMGESLGIVIFPSLVAYARFLDGAEGASQPDDGPIDLGTTLLALDFESGAELPDEMRQEIETHGWPVAGPDAYPVVHHRDSDGMPRPLSERDVAIVTACTTSLSAFFAMHRDLFDEDAAFEPVSESYFDDDELEVRFTVPYEAGPAFDLTAPGAGPARATKRGHASSAARRETGQDGGGGQRVGRNQLCPCGSGKKYKKCCMAADQAAQSASRAPAAAHDIDRRLMDDMLDFARRHLGDSWLGSVEDFYDHEQAAQLFAPWAVYHYLVEGRPIVDWYLEAKRHQLSNTELTWLEAQQASWLSVWEVLEVEVGRSLTLKDLLSDEVRTVHEAGGSRTVARRDALLGRIVDHEGNSVLCGIHPRPLPPVAAAEVVRRARGHLRRKRAVPIDRLREEKTGRYLIARWEETVEDLDIRRSVPPRLHNTDGEELLLTVDHFEFAAELQDQVERKLAQFEDVDPPEPDEEQRMYAFTRAGNAQHGGLESTLIGRAIVSPGKLRVESNSIERADALRSRIETDCGETIRHRLREHSDPLALMQGLPPAGAGGPAKRGRATSATPAEMPAEIPAEEAARVILEMKTRHYADWADHPLPALGGKTARQAVRTRAGREQVDLLLKDCENHEAREPPAQRFDFSSLRAELGLEA